MRSLSGEGRAAAQRIARLLQHLDVALIVSSPYTRAVQTARPLADRMGSRVCGAIERITAQAAGRTAVIASHGNALALFLRTLDPAVDLAFWARMSMPDVYAVEDLHADARGYHRVWT
jgi:broad specificity phosphatase PhoE